jgi:hypothetical protein
VLTKRRTFQKYYTQAEIKAFVEAALDEQPIPVAPGVLYPRKEFLALVAAMATTRRADSGRIADGAQRHGPQDAGGPGRDSVFGGSCGLIRSTVLPGGPGREERSYLRSLIVNDFAPVKLPSHILPFFPWLITCASAICLALFAPSMILAAGPSVATLLATCDRGFARGNTGVAAAACEWFAVPCECRSRYGNADIPGWCIPKSEPIEQTVRKVVAELRRYPEPTASIDSVVPEMLTKLYPCQPDRSE